MKRYLGDNGPVVIIFRSRCPAKSIIPLSRQDMRAKPKLKQNMCNPPVGPSAFSSTQNTTYAPASTSKARRTFSLHEKLASMCYPIRPRDLRFTRNFDQSDNYCTSFYPPFRCCQSASRQQTRNLPSRSTCPRLRGPRADRLKQVY